MCLSSYWVRCVAFKPDNANILVSGSNDKTIKVWDMPSGSCLSTLNVDAGTFGVQSVSFSPKGDMVAAGCYNGNIFFVDAAAGEIKSSLNVGGQVSSVEWSPCGSKMAATCKVYCLSLIHI